MALTDDEVYGQRTLGSRPSVAIEPPPPPPVTPQIVDRVAYNTQQQQQAQQQAQMAQWRDIGTLRDTLPTGEMSLTERQRLAYQYGTEQQQQAFAGLTSRIAESTPIIGGWAEAQARERADAAKRQFQQLEQGFLARGYDPEMARALAQSQLETLQAERPTGSPFRTAYRYARMPIPYAQQAINTVAQLPEAAGRAIDTAIAFSMPGRPGETGQERVKRATSREGEFTQFGRTVEPVARTLAEVSIPTEVWMAALQALPAYKARTVEELASAVLAGDIDALGALRNAGKRLGESAAVERGLGMLADERGFVRLGERVPPTKLRSGIVSAFPAAGDSSRLTQFMLESGHIVTVEPGLDQDFVISLKRMNTSGMGRQPGGTMTGLAEVGRLLDDLAKRNPDATFFAVAADRRLAKAYQRMGFDKFFEDSDLYLKLNPEKLRGTLQARLGEETGALRLPEFDFDLPDQAHTYVPQDPPGLFRLEDTVQPPMAPTAINAMEGAKAAASGNVVRTAANAIANKIDTLATAGARKEIHPAREFLRWFSKEADRFGHAMGQAKAIWERNRRAGQVWGQVEGSRLGDMVESAFGRHPNDTFISPVTGHRLQWNGHWLTNADVVENWHLFTDHLSAEQVQAARVAGEFVQRLRNEAMVDGARLGQAVGIDGKPVQSYVHREAISKDGEYFVDVADPARPGVKAVAEKPRDYTTRAEGIANGVAYDNSWQSNYTSHFVSLRTRMADLELKRWADSLSETLGERIGRVRPDVVARRARSVAERGAAFRALKDAEKAIRKRITLEDRRAVQAAQKALVKAERRLAERTAAPVIERVAVKGPNADAIGRTREALIDAQRRLIEAQADPRVGDPDAILREIHVLQDRLTGLTRQADLAPTVASRERLSQAVGKAREDLAAATASMRAAARDSVDTLANRMTPSERAQLANAKARLADAKVETKNARAAYNAAKDALEPNAPFEYKSPGGLPITQGRIFDKESAQYLREIAEASLGGREKGTLGKIIHVMASPFRFALLTADDSAALTQGYGVFVNNPLRWARAVAEAPLSAMSPRYRNWVFARRANTIAELAKYSSEAFDVSPEGFGRGSIFFQTAEALRKVPGGRYPAVIPGAFDRLFRETRFLLATEAWENFKYLAQSQDDLYDLGSAVTKLSGTARQSGFEGDLLLAARYFRGQTGFVLDGISNGGIQGKVARRTFMRLIAGAASITLAYEIYKGERDPKNLIKSITPGEPGAYTVEGINLLGSYAPLINAIGRSITHPKDAPETWAFYMRSKLNPLWAGLISGLSGENILGEPTNLKEQFLSLQAITPLSIQQMRENLGEGANPYIAVPAAILGAKYNPPTAYRQILDELDKQGIDAGDFFTQPGTRRMVFEQDPHLAELYENYEEQRRHGTQKQQDAQKIVDDSRRAIQEFANQIREGEATTDELREFTQDEAKKRSTLREALLGEFGESDTDLQPLWDTYEHATDPITGELDFEAALTEQAKILEEHPELREKWERQQFVPLTNDPLELAMKAGQKIVNQKYDIGGGQSFSWFGSNQQIWDQVVQIYNLPVDRYPTPESYEMMIADQARRAGVDPNAVSSRDPISKAYATGKSGVHKAILSIAPEVGANLNIWYDIDVPDSELSPAIKAQIMKATSDLYNSLGITPQ